ncbi:MAG: cytochrome P450, partial [Caldilineaceae bacterium]|nr:cytochrome P450 [Caldilineaceae bacterium]
MSITTIAQTAPGPHSRRPLRGNLPEFRHDRYNYLLQLHQEYGDVVRFQLGQRPIYLVAHPDDVLRVLGRNSSNYQKAKAYQVVAHVFGSQSVLITEGEEWRRQRRTMNPHFKRATLNSFTNMIVESTAEMLERWKAKADSGHELNMVTEMSKLTLSVVCKALFQIDISGEANELGQALITVLNHGSRRMESFLGGFLGILDMLPTEENRQYNAALQKLNAAIYSMIEDKKKKKNR